MFFAEIPTPAQTPGFEPRKGFCLAGSLHMSADSCCRLFVGCFGSVRPMVNWFVG